MKKFFALFLVFTVVAACLVGCSKKEPAPSQPTEPSVTQEEEYEISTELVPEGTAGQYLVVTAKDQNGKAVWTYQTAVCAVEEYETAQYLGKNGNTVYINEQKQITDEESPLFTGCLTAIDAHTGKIQWQSVEFAGSGAFCVFDDKGNIYLSSQDGPDCVAFNNFGLRMWFLEDISEEYDNAKSIELVDNELLVSFDNDEGEPAVVHVGLDGTVK